MQLLDQILAVDDNCLWASATTTKPVSSCWGIEYLGQATAAFFTLIQLRAMQTQATLDATNNSPVEPTAGMLIGSRRYQAHQPQFKANSLLLMQVTPRSKLTGKSTNLGLVKFQGSLWRADPETFSQLALSTPPSRLPYDTATLAALSSELLVEADLSVYIPPPQPTDNSGSNSGSNSG